MKKASGKCATPSSSPPSSPPPKSSSSLLLSTPPKTKSPPKSGTSAKGVLDPGSIPTVTASGCVSVGAEQWLQFMEYVQ